MSGREGRGGMDREQVRGGGMERLSFYMHN